MKYVNLSATVGGMSGVISPAAYLSKLPDLAAALPPGAREFAVDEQHYDFSSARCIKDLKISRIQVGDEDGGLEIGLRHNCWKHDDDLVIPTFGDVSGFGEVILDELLPHEYGCSHEIACWPGTLKVVSQDLIATWIPADCADNHNPT
jgi:hypothetical protein